MIGIVGIGLIGGSIGLRARELNERVAGFDTDETAIQAALACGAIDEAMPRARLYAECETVVIAAPPRATIEELRSAAALHVKAALVLDVASVKEPVVRAGEGIGSFVATHPLAGAERSGVTAARSVLFQGRSWIYVPAKDPALEKLVRKFILSMGAKPVAMAAQQHDELIALTSHLPQVFATLFAGRARDRAGDSLETISGPVAHELLRLSRSNPDLWAQILSYNAVNTAAEIRALAAALNDFAHALEGGAALTIRDAFLRAQP